MMTPDIPAREPQLDLASLASPFYPVLSDIGELRQLSHDELPAPYRPLLNHDDHMTTTLEAYHESLVDVRVIARCQQAGTYARQIVLTRQSDGGVVQFGIMRIATRDLDEELRAEIEAQQQPLGRILIRHNVLRHVQLDRLWEVVPSPPVRAHLEMKPDEVTYGRTAQIFVAGTPTVELLEIVTPCR